MTLTMVKLHDGVAPCGDRAPGAFLLEHPWGATALIQSDNALPHLAELLGWRMPDHIDPDASWEERLEAIACARTWLEEHAGDWYPIPSDALLAYTFE